MRNIILQRSFTIKGCSRVLQQGELWSFGEPSNSYGCVAEVFLQVAEGEDGLPPSFKRPSVRPADCLTAPSSRGRKFATGWLDEEMPSSAPCPTVERRGSTLNPAGFPARPDRCSEQPSSMTSGSSTTTCHSSSSCVDPSRKKRVSCGPWQICTCCTRTSLRAHSASRVSPLTQFGRRCCRTKQT